jgi:hypothetical protein
MYQRRILFFLSVFLFSAGLFAQQKQVMIRVIQSESTLLGDFQTTLRLERKSFKFQIMLRGVEGVYVFASIRDSVYRFTETSVIRDFSYLKLLELRDEDKFNTNRELNISETGWSYWFYKPDTTEHPFNRKVTRLDSGRVICTKVIRQLYNVGEGKVVKLRDVNTPLYLFIVAVSEYDENGQPKGELIRRKLKIEWEDD